MKMKWHKRPITGYAAMAAMILLTVAMVTQSAWTTKPARGTYHHISRIAGTAGAASTTMVRWPAPAYSLARTVGPGSTVAVTNMFAQQSDARTANTGIELHLFGRAFGNDSSVVRIGAFNNLSYEYSGIGLDSIEVVMNPGGNAGVDTIQIVASN
jgi:hypothetical protein